VVLLALTSQIVSFHALGHMVVARIAQFHLEDSGEGREALKWSQNLLEPFTFYCGEKDHPFVEASTWPDKIKLQGWKSFNNWHFKNAAVIAEGYTPVNKILVSNQNAVWAVNSISNFLSSNKVDTRGKSNSILGKSLSLRQLIHFIGDMH